MIYHGSCLDILPLIRAEFVDACVCDPPYNLASILARFSKPDAAPAQIGATGVYNRSSQGFMGQTWDTDVAFDPATWGAVSRVMKPGAHLVAFSGSRTYHRMVCAIEDAGFEIRDQIMWLYGSGFPKSHKVAPGQGTALKPAHEPIVLARKLVDRGNSISKNIEQWGTGGLAIDSCAVPGPRHPANLIHDGLTETWSKYFYHAKASHSDRLKRCEPCRTRHPGKIIICPSCGVMLTSGHPTVKPLALMQYLCRLVTPPGGTVLDPFAGTGSTILAAREEGFDAIGIEREEEYFLDMKWRLEQ